jgi:hypothetical protein
MFNFDFGDLDLSSLSNLSGLKDLSELKDIGPAVREVVREATREAAQASKEARREALQASKEARREALRESGEARREALRAAEDARRAARQFRVFSSDNGAVKSTTIDLGKAQITVTDPHGEMRIEKVNGKKMLTAKDPQGRLLFSGPVDSKEELDKVPAEVRQRYDKLEQKDLPGVISTASSVEEDADDESDAAADDMDTETDDDESSEPSEATMQQVLYRPYPRSFRTLNAISI